MGFERPAWVFCFGFICLLLLPGAVLTHFSVAKLIPSISDLPANLEKGFDEVFKFSYLEADSQKVTNNAAAVLTKCNVVAATYCPTLASSNTSVPGNGTSVPTTTERDAIAAAFAHSLTSVDKVANDPYLGTSGMQSTATNLNTMQSKVGEITSPMGCNRAIPTFCGLYESGNAIVQGMSEVTKSIDAFKNGDIIKRWEDNKGLLQFMHALPYFMVLALVCFAFFIWKNGVCCCCKQGTIFGSLAVLPFGILWLVSFIIYLVVLAVGFVIKYMQDKIEVPALNGKPTLDVAVDHLKKNFPEFWDIVFKELAEGLDLLWTAAFFFTIVALLVLIFGFCECCCCPWRGITRLADPKKDEGSGEPQV